MTAVPPVSDRRDSLDRDWIVARTELIISAIGAWFLMFPLLLAYWAAAEAAEPGRQYADPLLPCAFGAWLLGAIPAFVLHAVGKIFMLSWRWRR